MRSQKRRNGRLCLVLLLIIGEMTFSGCGRAVSPEQLQAAKTAYRIGYISEDFYRMTAAAYRRHESMPPVTIIEKMGYCVEKWLKLCLSGKP